MNRGKVINLSGLTQTHRDEIDQLARGIHGKAGIPLWTAQLRAATRGGKPCMLTRVDDAGSARA
jgi:hypothetical protein